MLIPATGLQFGRKATTTNTPKVENQHAAKGIRQGTADSCITIILYRLDDCSSMTAIAWLASMPLHHLLLQVVVSGLSTLLVHLVSCYDINSQNSCVLHDYKAGCRNGRHRYVTCYMLHSEDSCCCNTTYARGHPVCVFTACCRYIQFFGILAKELHTIAAKMSWAVDRVQ